MKPFLLHLVCVSNSITFESYNAPSYVIVEAQHRRRYSLASFPPDSPLPSRIHAAGSLLASGYPGGGGTLSAGLTFAYIAAEQMAQTIG